MLGDKLAHLINSANAVQVTLALRVTPGEKAVAAEDQTVGAWILLCGPLQHEGEFKSRPLPGKP